MDPRVQRPLLEGWLDTQRKLRTPFLEPQIPMRTPTAPVGVCVSDAIRTAICEGGEGLSLDFVSP